jgi:sugar fermentation stimulation protein A
MSLIPFDLPVIQASLQKRYKRFLADVIQEDGSVLTVHVPNSGSMKSCIAEGWPCLISDSGNPRRKLRHTLEATWNGDTWIGVQTHRANQLAGEALRRGLVPGIDPAWDFRAEVKMGEKSRVDWLACHPDGKRCWVEVKSVTLLMDDGCLAFPDAVSTRAHKHLLELVERIKEGDRAMLLLLVQRQDGSHFRPADEIDPEYGRLFRAAMASGVEVQALRVKVSPDGFDFAGAVDVNPT